MKEVFDAVFEVLVSKEDCNVVLFAIRGGNQGLAPTTLAGAEHFLLQRAEKDGSSPLLRSVTLCNVLDFSSRVGASACL